VHRSLLALAVFLAAACGELSNGQAGAPTSASPSASPSQLTATATTDCVALAKTTPVTVPPLLVTDLGNGTQRVTNAEGGYTIVAPSAWLVAPNNAGIIEPLFGHAHFSSFDPRAAPTSRPQAGGMLPPEVGIHLDLEIWWNPDHLVPERFADIVRVGPDQVGVDPGTTLTVAGQRAYRFTIRDERKFQPNNAPLITTRQTRAVWLVPTLRDDRMLVVAATPAESSLLPAAERAVATIAIAPPIRAERPVTLQRSEILKQWLVDKTGATIPGRRVEAKLMTYAEASSALNAPHTARESGAPTGGGAGSRAIPRFDWDPDALYWVVAVSGPGLPEGRRGPALMSSASPPATAWILYTTPATSGSMSGTGAQYAGASAASGRWPLGFDALADRCR
jgi:hypothetical protein